jgi:hypothetical protein
MLDGYPAKNERAPNIIIIYRSKHHQIISKVWIGVVCPSNMSIIGLVVKFPLAMSSLEARIAGASGSIKPSSNDTPE